MRETRFDKASRRLVGDLRQLASVRRIVLDDGPDRGVADSQEFRLVPWRPELLQIRGREISLAVQDRTITIARGVERYHGLSR